MVKISIIMPVFNAENFLESSCKSLFNQTFKDVELICVDDGSTDNSLSKLFELKEKYGFIKIITQENQGSGKARNYGMDNANGEYIAFLDADDIFVDDDALEKMYDFGVKHNADMVAGNLKRVGPDGKLEDNFNYKEGNYAYFSKFEVIKPEDYGIPWAFYKNIFKTEFLNKFNIRFPDLKRGQDPVLLAEVLVNIDKIAAVPVDLYGYNYAAGGGANSKVNDYIKKYDFIKHFKDTFEILERAGFNDIADRYKQRLEIHLRLNRNRNDQELHDIVWEIFGNVCYYDKYKEKLFNLRVPNILDNMDESNFENEYVTIKNSFFNMSFVDDYFTPYDTMEKYLSINNSNISDNVSMVPIININKLLKEKNSDLNSKKELLTDEIYNLGSINEDLDSNIPNIIVDDIEYSFFHEDFHELKMEILKIVLDDDNLLEYDFIEKYKLLLDKFDLKDEYYLNILENHNKKLVVENEYLYKQKEYLKQELNELI